MPILSLKSQHGIALIQVLIISIILTMLGIYISQTVRSQVATTYLMQQSNQVSLSAENVEAELLHTLLTNKRYVSKSSESNLVKKWNFYGKPFQYDDHTQITIQDMSSLLSLNYLNKRLATRLFEQLGYQGHEVRTFLDSLSDWKDKDELKRLNGAEKDYYQSIGVTGPRNGFLQSIDEVLSIKQSELLTITQWKRYFSLSLVSKFNPMNAPETILKVFINNDEALKEVLELRGQGNLTALNFYQATGIEEDDGISFTTGRILKIKIVTKIQNIQFNKSFIVDLRPNASSRAVTFSNVTWNNE